MPNQDHRARIEKAAKKIASAAADWTATGAPRENAELDRADAEFQAALDAAFPAEPAPPSDLRSQIEAAVDYMLEIENAAGRKEAGDELVCGASLEKPRARARLSTLLAAVDRIAKREERPLVGADLQFTPGAKTIVDWVLGLDSNGVSLCDSIDHKLSPESEAVDVAMALTGSLMLRLELAIQLDRYSRGED